VTLDGVSVHEQDFEQWYEVARPRVIATVTMVCADQDLAAEATDEAFVRALARWSSVRAMESRTGWAVRVAINLTKRRARRRAIEHRLLRREVPRGEMPAAAGEIWLLVRDLPARQREVIVLRYVADLPEAAIAAVLGISRSAASSALSDGRRRLAAELAADATDAMADTDTAAVPDAAEEQEVPHG
jgi:RNA polymerase sigma factor (sigma-70 family)